jgi:RNase P/RNase MRP subunit p29
MQKTAFVRLLVLCAMVGACVPVRVDGVTDEMHTALTGFEKGARRIQFSLDDPTLSFSNRGQLVRVSGTRIYARPN